MAEPLVPDVVVNVCHNCIPDADRLPRQWKQDGALVVVREIPCSGKIDGQYLLHTIESVDRGVCVVACPTGQCQLGQGNYRAEVRLQTVRRLLSEIGLEPERAELLHCGAAEPRGRLEQLIRGAVKRLCALGQSPLRASSSGDEPGSTRDPTREKPAATAGVARA
jgi:F420-non-reducing hydrogenase iron-sulfur subunit